MTYALLVIVASAGLASCKSSRSACSPTEAQRVNVWLTVVDSINGAELPSATLITAANGVTDTVQVRSIAQYPVVVGHTAGAYSLSVQSAGYTQWLKQIVVPTGQCNANVYRVTAEMQPGP